jgi:hypothetical protein
MSVPIFIHITTGGQIWASNNVAFLPSGSLAQSFRINSDTASQLVCTLTGSGNASASALSVAVATKSGKAEGNEIH